MDLKSKTIVGRGKGPRLLIIAGVHGDEWEPMAAARRLLGEINPDVLRGSVTIVPCVNEAAFSRAARTAADGLDLARVCPGRDDGTITEQTAAALSRLIREHEFLIDLHTGGTAFQLLKLAGYGIHPDAKVQARQREMARAFNLPVVWGTDGRFKGTSLSVAREAGVPAIYVENGGGGCCDWIRVEELVAGCRNVARVLGMLNGESPADGVRYFIEDDRPSSGHLQSKCPSPASGFFMPEVGLGDVVQKGQPLGHVVDALGEQSVAVPAYRDGTVLMLRATPSVKTGDPLAAILPICAPGEARFEHDG